MNALGWQDILALLLAAVALTYVVRRLTPRASKPGCARGCGTCAQPASPTTTQARPAPGGFVDLGSLSPQAAPRSQPASRTPPS
jgi:hypothetical protein